MKLFHCQCGNQVFFHNSRCNQCARKLAYAPDQRSMLSLEPKSGLWVDATSAVAAQMQPCRNYVKEDVCNWLVNTDSREPYCRACRLNELIPDLSQPKHRDYWYRIESAKRHLLYTLFQLGLPVVGKDADAEKGMSFVFMKDSPEGLHPEQSSEFADVLSETGRVMTGHYQGRITINIDEADHVKRTRARESFQEHYRTLLGHFRHEIGHYYWNHLVTDSDRWNELQAIFGDTNQDYGESLEAYYKNGAVHNWQQHYISAYASMHPLEDWAECWAHYLHMVDTLETAFHYGFVAENHSSQSDFEQMMSAWQRLTPGLNALSRSLGVRDIYPFVINDAVKHKLAAVHNAIVSYRQSRG